MDTAIKTVIAHFDLKPKKELKLGLVGVFLGIVHDLR